MTPPTRRDTPANQAFTAWPVAVRSAEKLAGTLVKCGPGLRPAAWPESCDVRAAALAPWYTDQRVAVRRTAAWVLGATSQPGRPLQFSTLDGRRAQRVDNIAMTLQQLQIDAEDVSYCGSYAVTSALRTTIDLLRESRVFCSAHRACCRLLLRRVPGGGVAVRDRLLAGTPFYRNVALARLHECDTSLRTSS